MGLGHFLHSIWRFFHPKWAAMSQKQIADIDRAVAESMAQGSFSVAPRQDSAGRPDRGHHHNHPYPYPFPHPHHRQQLVPTGDQLWNQDIDDIESAKSTVRGGGSVFSGSGGGGGGGGGGGSVYSMSRPPNYTSPARTPPYYMSPARTPPLTNGVHHQSSNDGHLWSMSSRGRAGSMGSSRGRDSGYAEPPAPLRKYASAAAAGYYRNNDYSYDDYSDGVMYRNESHYGGGSSSRGSYDVRGRSPPYYNYNNYQYPAPSYYPGTLLLSSDVAGGRYPSVRPPLEGNGDDEKGFKPGRPVNAPF